MIKSVVLPAGLSIEDKIIFGADGSAVDKDSNIPNTLKTSGVLRDIFSSCTRVPKGYPPAVNPSFKVAPPVPDPVNDDLSISSEFILCFLLTFAVTPVFAKVATSVASKFPLKSDPTLLICKVPLPSLNSNLSSVNLS